MQPEAFAGHRASDGGRFSLIRRRWAVGRIRALAERRAGVAAGAGTVSVVRRLFSRRRRGVRSSRGQRGVGAVFGGPRGRKDVDDFLIIGGVRAVRS